MARIFISAGHFTGDSGAISVLGTKEADEMMKTRNFLLQELESRGLKKDIDFFSVPDTIDLGPSVKWINNLSDSGDVAIELHGNDASALARGTEAYYVEGNTRREADANMLLDALVLAVPGLQKRSAKSDNQSQHPRLAFCRDVDIPSVLIELCFLTNRADMDLLTNQRSKFAKGLADGLIKWSGLTVSNTPIPTPFPPINIEINGQIDSEKGIIVNNNAFIPVDLAERLGIKLTALGSIRRVQQDGIVFIKAVDLQPLNISVKWNGTTKTVALAKVAAPIPLALSQIMGAGSATENQLKSFLQANNPTGLSQFPDLSKLYIEESRVEGVNHNIAFAQMCLETDYLSFGGSGGASQNNFCGLGKAQGETGTAVFPDPRTGVKAHIQHLTAYASVAPPVPPIVDPRFNLVERGIAPLVTDLGGRWAASLNYGNKILDIQRRFLSS
jgi:hypothetical protein